MENIDMDQSSLNTRTSHPLKRSYDAFDETGNAATQHTGPDDIPVVLEKYLANKLTEYGKLTIDGTIGDGELLELTSWIAGSPSRVKDIDIDLCVDSDYLAGLLRALTTNNKITRLTLSDGFISNEVGEACAQMLRLTKSIDLLRIGGNWASSAGSLVVFQALGNNTTLRTLSIENPEFGEAGMEALATSLKTNRNIKTLHLMEVPINDAAAECLANAIRDNDVLDKLTITRSGLGTSAAKKLLQGILESQSLTSVTLPEHNFEEEDEARLLEVFRRNRHRSEHTSEQ